MPATRLLPVVLLAALLTSPGSASAQAAITGGLTQPATSPALVDGAGSAVVNPAGVAFHRGLTLRYLHEDRDLERGGLGDTTGNGLYFALGSGEGVGASLSVEWLTSQLALAPAASIERGTDRRTTWAIAFGERSGALGAALHLYEGDTTGIDTLVSADIGFQSRPSRFVSLGLVVRDVSEPRLRGKSLPRSYLAGVAVRPFGDVLTLGVDGSVLENDAGGRQGGFDGVGVGVLAQAKVTDGVVLQARVDTVAGSDQDVGGQLGLALDLEHLGLATSGVRNGGVAGGDGTTGIVLAVQATSAAPRFLDVRPRPRVVVIDLEEELTASAGFRIFSGRAEHPMIDAIAGFERLARDERVEGVVLKMGDLPDVGFGRAYELRQAILGLRSRGKKVAALLTGAGDAEYYVASAADEVWCTREAALLVNGLSGRALFFGATLGDIGITVDAVRIGKYKNAPDELVRADASEEQKEVLNALLDSIYATYVADLAVSRRMAPDDVKKALDAGILPPARAKELGLIDQLVYPDELEDAVARLMGGKGTMRDATLRPPEWPHWGAPPVIAIVPVEGLIAMGKTAGDPFGLVHAAGADTIVEALESAAADPGVKAIVLRIDSGGGDAQASDLIWRAVRKASEKKPVIASMGDTAASGGYYAAVGAKRIFATPTTITGSIGIFALKPAVQGLLGKIDAGVWGTTRGQRADILGLVAPWTPEEREAMQAYITSSYNNFLGAVGEGRAMTVEDVDKVAQGRVWTGEQAKERKLVDTLGGLSSALAAAAEAAGIGPDLPVELRVVEPAGGLFDVGTGGSALPAPLVKAVRTVVPAPLLVEGASGVWALLPWEITLD